MSKTAPREASLTTRSPPLPVSPGTLSCLPLLIILFTVLPAPFPLDPELWEGRDPRAVWLPLTLLPITGLAHVGTRELLLSTHRRNLFYPKCTGMITAWPLGQRAEEPEREVTHPSSHSQGPRDRSTAQVCQTPEPHLLPQCSSALGR